MTPAEATAEAARLLTMMRVVMPRASDHEIFNAVAGDIRAPWDAPDRVAKDYEMVRRELERLALGRGNASVGVAA